MTHEQDEDSGAAPVPVEATSVKTRSAFWMVVLPLLIVMVGIGAKVVLTRMEPEAKEKEKTDGRPLVQIEVAKIGNHPLKVRANGSVLPSQQIQLQAEVGGRITWQHEDFVPGGRFKADDLLLRIDGRNYQVAIEQQRAQLGRSQMEFELEQGRQSVAKREWEIMGGEKKNDLALRGPQVRTAQANLRAAQGSLKRARLDLGKTSLRAPFDGIIQSENVDVGQLVAPQGVLATMTGTRTAWVQVSIPSDRLRWIGLDAFDSKESPTAIVHYESGGTKQKRIGKVTRLLGELDPNGRMARVLIEVQDPLSLSEENRDKAPLFFGSYVEVEIQGHTLEDGIRIPRRALREGNLMHIASKENTLEIRAVTPAWREKKFVILQQGLRPGEKYITSRIVTPVPGTKLRIQEATTASSKKL